jgi:hypothetical protein
MIGFGSSRSFETCAVGFAGKIRELTIEITDRVADLIGRDAAKDAGAHANDYSSDRRLVDSPARGCRK